MRKSVFSIAVAFVCFCLLCFLCCPAAAVQPKISLDRLNDSQPHWSITMDEDANITLDGGNIFGAINPPADCDVYIYSNGANTISQWANGTQINCSTSPHLAIEAAIVALPSGGSLSLRNSITVTDDIDITESNIHFNGNGYTITAGAGCTDAVFSVDSVGINESINGFWLTCCTVLCSDIAAHAVEFTGHYVTIPNGFHRIVSVSASNATSSTFKFNTTIEAYLYDVSSWYSDASGILFDEACMNIWVTKYTSQYNTYGLQIGGNNPAPNHRCEGIFVTDSLMFGDLTAVYIRGVLYADISHCILDYSTGNVVYVEGDSDSIAITESWMSGSAQTEAYNCINLNPTSATVSNVVFSHNNIGDAGYCGIKASYVDGLIVTENTIFNNARIDTGGVDVMQGACTNSIISNNDLKTTAGNYAIYSGWASNGTIFTENHYADAIYIADVLNVTQHNMARV